MEYVGEVLDYREFKKRTKKYDTEDKIHHYFMALNADQIIDATRKGSISRFINHSCDPNSETQKVSSPFLCFRNPMQFALQFCRRTEWSPVVSPVCDPILRRI